MINPQAIVAIVDDEAPIRRALIRLLRSAGIASRGFAGGSEFLESLEASAPDCVVLDLNMPGMSGLDVLSRMATRWKDIPVIIVTGNHSADAQMRAMESHPVAYLPKPINDQSLLDAVEAGLRRRAPVA
jgi:FixJ family two-component response regulator